jgi:hypothetical protein
MVMPIVRRGRRVGEDALIVEWPKDEARRV